MHAPRHVLFLIALAVTFACSSRWAIAQCTCNGDVNGDNQVTPVDIPLFVGCLLVPGGNCACADMNNDLLQDGRDVSSFVARLGSPDPNCSTGGGGGGHAACADSTNDCCTAAEPGTTGCSVPACCNCICNLDPFCCDISWDNICGYEAAHDCHAVCPCEP